MYRRSTTVEFQQIDDEGVLLEMESGRYFRVNSSATEIWKLLEYPADADQLIDQLREMYAETSLDISGDVRQVLTEMARLGVIEGSEVDGTTPAR